MGNLKSLSLSMKRLKSNLKTKTNDITVSFALDVVTELAFRTPADTSTALSNWIVSVGSSVVRKRPPFVEGSRGSTRIASAEQTVASAQGSLKGRKFGQFIYIVNNTEYIRDLNDGSSTQAPAEFVSISVAAAKRRVRKLGFKKL